MSFGKISKLACVVLALSIGFEGVGLAQSRRPAGVGSLLEMKCNGKGLFVMGANADVLIVNRRPYTPIGAFAEQSVFYEPWGVKRGQTLEVTCDLAGRNRSPVYRNLTMAVAMHEQSRLWAGRYAARVRLTTYTDGQYAGSTEVAISELNRFSIDISGVRSVAFSVECFNPSEDNLCPSLFILEDKLY